MTMKLDINAHAQVAWQEVGDHGTQVLVVDDFLTHPDELRALGLGLAYRPPAAPDYYPGTKAFISLPGSAETKAWAAERMLERLYPRNRPDFFRTDDFDSGGVFSVFSVDRARALEGVQDPHTDNVAWLGMVLHLSSTSEGRGTAMWEHRPTGMQQWLATDPVRLHLVERTFGLRLNAQLANAVGRVRATSNDELARILFDAKRSRRKPFSTEEDETWRLLAYIPARPNRLVVYPTWQIHSVVDMADDATAPPELRLTYNQMVEYPLPRELRRDRTAYDRRFYRDPPGLRR